MIDEKLPASERGEKDLPPTQTESDDMKVFSRFRVTRDDGILLATGCVFSINKIVIYGMETGIISIYNSLEMVYNVFSDIHGCDVQFIDRAIGVVKESDVLN